MSFKTDAEFYGLNTANAVPGADLILAPGKTLYGKVSFGPTGLMLRKLNAIYEAVEYGGLLIVSADSVRWQFYAGDTLRAVLANQCLGACATNMPDALNAESAGELEFSQGQRFYRSQIEGGQYNFTVIPTIISRPRPRVASYWGPTESVKLYAIVTGATSGYGQSHHAGLVCSTNSSLAAYYRSEFTRTSGSTEFPIYSYMRTDVPMRVPFGKFVANTSDEMLKAMPSEARPYYSRTKAAALAAWGSAHPTIAVHTCWVNGVLSDSIPVAAVRALTRHKVLDMYVPNTTGLMLRAPSPPSSDERSVPWVSALRSKCGSSQYNMGTPGPTVQQSEIIDYYVPDFGLYARDIQLPFVCWSNLAYKPSSRPNLTGSMEGLAAGQLKDGHVVARALIDGNRYAANEAVQQDVMQVLREAIGPTREAELFNRTVLASGGTDADAVKNATELTNLLGSPKLKGSAFDTGTLMDHISGFIDDWDKKAYALARSEN